MAVGIMYTNKNVRFVLENKSSLSIIFSGNGKSNIKDKNKYKSNRTNSTTATNVPAVPMQSVNFPNELLPF